MGKKTASKNRDVLVGVLKSRDDLRILLKTHWYRIPSAHLPESRFNYVAFYQPISFDRQGKRIEYYARVSSITMAKRSVLLPRERCHPRAKEDYARIGFSRIYKLPKPIENTIPRRVCFGFTTLQALRSARNILELYDVPPTEQIIGKLLDAAGIQALKEYPVSCGGKKYRVDFAVFGKKSRLAVECDNDKAHGSKAQIQKDKTRDSCLRRCGWKVVRLKEREIMEHPDKCIRKIKKQLQGKR